MKKIFSLMIVFGVIIFGFGSGIASATSSGWTTVGKANFNYAGPGFVSLAFNPENNQPYVAFSNVIYGNNAGGANVMKFNGTSWVSVGKANFSAGEADYISFAFNPANNQPYVAYRDMANGFKATVMKFDGTNWVNVGSAGFSAGQADYPSLAFNPVTNQPYVAYEDGANGFGATVMKFNGTSWENVGIPAFSVNEADSISLAFNPATNQPYVAYANGPRSSNGDKAKVMKFNGISWEAVGSTISAGEADSISFAFNPANNQPYLAYENTLNGGKATVMTFNGISWTAVGNVDFSAGNAEYLKLVFNLSNNYPYLAFSDGTKSIGNGYKATVMAFDGNSWTTVGGAGFSAEADGISFAFNPATNQPYVAYVNNLNNTEEGYDTVMKFDSTCSSFIYTCGICQSNSTMSCTVASSSPFGCSGGAPVLTQPCTYNNGIIIPNSQAVTITSYFITSLNKNFATIKWATDNSSTGKIIFGSKIKVKKIKYTTIVNGEKKTTTTKTVTISGGGTLYDATNNTSHSFSLIGLRKNKTYYYQIIAQNGSYTSQTSILQFKTPKR